MRRRTGSSDTPVRLETRDTVNVRILVPWMMLKLRYQLGGEHPTYQDGHGVASGAYQARTLARPSDAITQGKARSAHAEIWAIAGEDLEIWVRWTRWFGRRGLPHTLYGVPRSRAANGWNKLLDRQLWP